MVGPREGLDGAVHVGRGGGVVAEQGLEVLVGVVERRHLVQADHVGGQRPRLVGAEDVDVGERLHGVGLLDQHPLAQHADGAEGVGEGDREHEAVGDEGDDDGRHAHALDERQVLADAAAPDEDGEGEHDDEQRADDEVDLALQGRQLAAVAGRLGGELVGEALEPDLLGLVVAAAGGAEAAREQGVAVGLEDEVGLTGEERLVDLEPALAAHAPVDDYLVAGAQAEQVADHDLRGVDLALGAVAHDRRLGARQDRDAVDGALGADLLKEADERVGQDHADGDEGVEVAAEDDEEDPEAEVEVVDEVEDVGADDLLVGAAGVHLDVVALAGGAAARRFGVAETARRGAAGPRSGGRADGLLCAVGGRAHAVVALLTGDGTQDTRARRGEQPPGTAATSGRPAPRPGWPTRSRLPRAAARHRWTGRPGRALPGGPA